MSNRTPYTLIDRVENVALDITATCAHVLIVTHDKIDADPVTPDHPLELTPRFTLTANAYKDTRKA